MNKTKTNKANPVAGALAGVTMLVGGTEIAVAGLMTQTQSTNIPSVLYQANGAPEGTHNVLEFNLFDPSLGSLQEVYIEMEDSLIGILPDLSVANNSGSSLQGTFIVDFSNATGMPFSNPWFSQAIDSTVICLGGTCNALGEDSATINQQMTYNVDFSDFIGVGSFDVAFGFNNITLVDADGIYAGTPFSLEGSGLFTVRYTYETVPIPGTLALTALGLGALAATRRRRNRPKR